MEVMRAIQGVTNPKGRVGNGQLSAKMLISERRSQNLEGLKSQCKVDTGLSYPIIRKWWDY